MKDNLEEKAQKEIKRIEDLLLKELENLACPAAEILPDAIRLTEFVHATNRLRPALIRFLDILEEETQKEIASLTEAHIEQIREEAKREALKPFKGARNPGEWEDNVWWEGRLKALEEMRAFLKEKIDIHLEIERTRTSYPKDWHEGNRNGLYDALTHLDSLTK